MENSIDFKDLWNKQTISQPNIEDLLAKVRKFKKTALRSLLITNIMLIATCIFIVCIWYYYQPQFISTKIGIVLIIIAIVAYLIVNNRMLKTYVSIDSSKTNLEYVQNLIVIKRKQQFLQTTILSLYFVLLTVGICLYMYEYASRMTVFYALITYGITLLWVGINWFYFFPKQIKKQQAKINTLIEKFENIDHQFESDL